MGSTNKTTNYELSQFVGTDKPSWLGDYNADMSKIDLAIKARAVEAGQAQASADTANGKADALDTRMDTAEDNILALQNASTTDHTQIATNTANISQNAQDIVQLDAKIGHTQITIGDHTVTGAISVLAQGSGDADNISYDNTTSGLTATNVQAAIDEVAGEIPDDASDVAYSNTQSGLTATNVQSAIDELASNPASNVRWNSTTDRFEVLKNGSWTQSIRAFVNSIAVYVGGLFGLTYDSTAKPNANKTNAGGFVLDTNSFHLPSVSVDQTGGAIFEGVDITNYNTITVKTNIPSYETVTLNVSALSGTVYLYIFEYVASASTGYIYVGLSSTNTDGYGQSGSKIMSEDIDTGSVAPSTYNFTEITIA